MSTKMTDITPPVRPVATTLEALYEASGPLQADTTKINLIEIAVGEGRPNILAFTLCGPEQEDMARFIASGLDALYRQLSVDEDEAAIQ